MPQQNLIMEIIKKIRRKIWRNKIIEMLVNGLFYAAVLLLILTLTLFFYPVVYAPIKAFYIVAGIMVFVLLIGIFKRPGLYQAAAEGDSNGLEERLITYWEYKEEDSLMVEILNDEVENALREKDLSRMCSLKISGRKLLLSAVIFVVIWGVYLLPVGKRQEAEKKEEVNVQIKKEAQDIKELRSEMASEISDKEGEKVLSALIELERNMKSSYDFNRAAAEVTAAQKNLNQCSGNSSEALEAMAGLFAGTGVEHEELQKALESGNINKALELSNGEQFSAPEQEALLQNMEKQRNILENSGLKEELSQLEAALKEQALTGDKLSEALESMAKRKKLQEVIEKTDLELQECKERLLARAEQGIKTPGGKDQLESFAMGETAGYDMGERTSEQGGDLATGGNGNSAMSNPNGIGGGGQNASGKSNGQSAFGEVEKLEEDVRLGDDKSSTSQVKGQWGEEGSIIDKTADQVPAETGEYKYIERAVSTFQEQGMAYVEKFEVPLEREPLVMRYFSQLNGGNIDAGKSN